METAQSGEAADAVRTLQAELRSEYSEIRSAEIQLTEAILSAHAVTVSGRSRLQDIQRHLIEAINNPATALDTPAGERHFLMFLKSLVAEIQDIVDTGALSDDDHAALTRALASGYLPSPPDGADAPLPTSRAGAPPVEQTTGAMPAAGPAIGALPQAAQGAATAPAQGASGLAGAATPLAGLASELLGRHGDDPPADETTDVDDSHKADDKADHEADHEADDNDEDDEDDVDGDMKEDRPSAPLPHSDREPRERGPAATRPSHLA
jgi:hypothetical protein